MESWLEKILKQMDATLASLERLVSNSQQLYKQVVRQDTIVLQEQYQQLLAKLLKEVQDAREEITVLLEVMLLFLVQLESIAQMTEYQNLQGLVKQDIFVLEGQKLRILLMERLDIFALWVTTALKERQVQPLAPSEPSEMQKEEPLWLIV